MSLTTFAAKWGAGPTLAATMIGGAALGATVAAFQFTAIGHTLGILAETLPMVGPAMQEGREAVGDAPPAAERYTEREQSVEVAPPVITDPQDG